jgi:hypothetical protein
MQHALKQLLQPPLLIREHKKTRKKKIRIQASIRSAEFASDVVIKGRFELAKDQREGRLAKIK